MHTVLLWIYPRYKKKRLCLKLKDKVPMINCLYDLQSFVLQLVKLALYAVAFF